MLISHFLLSKVDVLTLLLTKSRKTARVMNGSYYPGLCHSVHAPALVPCRIVTKLDFQQIPAGNPAYMTIYKEKLLGIFF